MVNFFKEIVKSVRNGRNCTSWNFKAFYLLIHQKMLFRDPQLTLKVFVFIELDQRNVQTSLV